MAAAFDAAAEKLSAPVSNAAASAATNASDGLSPLALAALREAVGASGADYLLHVALRSMGGETATKSKSLLARGGALALTGHSAASFLLLDRAKGNIAAADLVGAGAAMRLDAGDAQFGRWGYLQFGRMAAGA